MIDNHRPIFQANCILVDPAPDPRPAMCLLWGFIRTEPQPVITQSLARGQVTNTHARPEALRIWRAARLLR